MSHICSNRLLARFFSPDSDHFFHRADKKFSVANLARLGRLDNRLDHRDSLRVGNHKFNFYFWQKIHRVFAAAINFRVALLTAKAFH